MATLERFLAKLFFWGFFFSEQSKHIVTCYKKDIKVITWIFCGKPHAWMVVNPIMADNFASLYNCTTVG